HGLGHCSYSAFMNLIMVCADVWSLKSKFAQLFRLDKPRLFQLPARGKSTNGVGRLNGRDADLALPDRDKNCFYGLPLHALVTPAPFLGGNQSRYFTGEIDAGLAAKSG